MQYASGQYDDFARVPRSKVGLPRGIRVEQLRDATAEWSRQFEALGLNSQ
jgi:hypothetical protein